MRPAVVTAGWLAAWPRLLSPLGDGVLAVKQRPATSLLMILPEFPLPQTGGALPGESPSTQQVLSYNGGGVTLVSQKPGRGQWGEGGSSRQRGPVGASSFREHCTAASMAVTPAPVKLMGG